MYVSRDGLSGVIQNKQIPATEAPLAEIVNALTDLFMEG